MGNRHQTATSFMPGKQPVLPDVALSLPHIERNRIFLCNFFDVRARSGGTANHICLYLLLRKGADAGLQIRRILIGTDCKGMQRLSFFVCAGYNAGPKQTSFLYLHPATSFQFKCYRQNFCSTFT